MRRESFARAFKNLSVLFISLSSRQAADSVLTVGAEETANLSASAFVTSDTKGGESGLHRKSPASTNLMSLAELGGSLQQSDLGCVSRSRNTASRGSRVAFSALSKPSPSVSGSA